MKFEVKFFLTPESKGIPQKSQRFFISEDGKLYMSSKSTVYMGGENIIFACDDRYKITSIETQINP